MKTILISITIAAFFAILFLGCKDDTIQSTIEEQTLEFAGLLTSHSACKSFQTAWLVVDSADSSSCIIYSFDVRNNALTLKHVNAGFNCCPGNLYCLINLRNDTIFVEENEEIPGCNCCCLFDIDMEITGIVGKKYHFIFIEPYCGDQEKLYFDVDLAVVQQGSYSVKRTIYPWGE